jgi:class 3 adenylate cyclase
MSRLLMGLVAFVGFSSLCVVHLDLAIRIPVAAGAGFFSLWFAFRVVPERIHHLSRAYGRFLPTEFVRLLGCTNVAELKLGDHVERTMTILFSDIRDFTRLSETMTPEQTFRFLNSYLSHMEPIVQAYGGFIDKYIGDAIMGLFPSADAAVRCTIAMHQTLHTYNEGRARAGYGAIRIGIGLNTGDTMLGTLGGPGRMEGTVIGTAVNLASRIEGVTKRFGATVVISDSTYRALATGSELRTRPLDRIKVKGHSQPLLVHEVFDGDPEALRHSKAASLKDYQEAIRLYEAHDYTAAQAIFARIETHFPNDPVPPMYRQRCHGFSGAGTKLDDMVIEF